MNGFHWFVLVLACAASFSSLSFRVADKMVESEMADTSQRVLCAPDEVLRRVDGQWYCVRYRSVQRELGGK